MNSWLSILKRIENGEGIAFLLEKINPAQWIKRLSLQYGISESKMFQQMLIQSCELTNVNTFEYLVQWGKKNLYQWMPGPQHLCAEILYRPQGCALDALNYIVAHVNVFPKDQQEKAGFPLTTAIYTGNHEIWDGLTTAFPQSFDPCRIIQAIILSEEKKAVEWFFSHQKCQNLDSEFYFNLLSFVCTNYSQFGEEVVNKYQQQIMLALNNIMAASSAFEFPLAHRYCRVTKNGKEDDLSHVLWVCNAEGGRLLLEYLSPFISCPSHLQHMMSIAQFDSAELLHIYVNDPQLDQIIPNIPLNLLDKTAKTSKLYARFMNKRLHQAICSHEKGATDKVVRRM